MSDRENKVYELLYRTCDAIKNDKTKEENEYHKLLQQTILEIEAPAYIKVAIMKKVEEAIQNYRAEVEKTKLFRNIKMGPIKTKEKLEFDSEVFRLTHPTL